MNLPKTNNEAVRALINRNFRTFDPEGDLSAYSGVENPEDCVISDDREDAPVILRDGDTYQFLDVDGNFETFRFSTGF